MGEDLRHVRLSADRTMEEVAKDVGVSRATISNWEKGIGKPDIDQFLDFYSYCGRNMKIIYEEIFSIRGEIKQRDEDEKLKRASKRNRKKKKSDNKQK